MCKQLRGALPRLMSRHLGKDFFDKLPELLKDPPDEHEYTKGNNTDVYMLVAEARVNVEGRQKDLKLQIALEKVAKELEKYDVPRPEPSHDHMCPISHSLMRDPVSAADGHVYEKGEILHWINVKKAEGQVLSPKTGEALPNLNLVPAHAIRSQISDWLEQHKLKLEDFSNDTEA